VVALPSGTVTFLFTDLEGSTRLWEEHPEAMRAALSRHDEILREAITAHNGHVVKTTGDGFHLVFSTPEDALRAAGDAQLALTAEAWGPTGALRVRMGLHTCQAELRDGDYFGAGVNRAARLMSIAHGGQIVLSAVTAELVAEAGFELVALGEHGLAGLSRPERVWQLNPVGLDREFPSLRSVDSVPGNLPRQVTSFVGRDVEIDQLVLLLQSRSLVTLTGVGGVGKTRLALEAAASVVGEFPDGAWLCELASLSDPDALWQSLAAVFRVLPMPGQPLDETVLGFLGSRRLLLVLDNSEHLLDAVAKVVDALARRCPGVVVLVTSREGLALMGEQLVAVPSLGVPENDAPSEAIRGAEAVILFCDRAQSVRGDFVLTDRNAGAVATLCRRLDGIPLAVELAAARVGSLTPEDIVDHLDQRFKLLTRGSRAALERHQTLRNTIDWSYDLLTGAECEALNRLSVFAGGCDLAAAQAVLGTGPTDVLDVLDVLGQLVDKSLVVAEPDDDGHLRYRLLETIRQYAQERLEGSGQQAATRQRHGEYFVAFAESAGPRLRGPDELRWGHTMTAETDNLRAALDWCVDSNTTDLALRLVPPLEVSIGIGYSALDWAERAVAIPAADQHPLFADVASWAAWSATLRFDFDRAAALTAAIDIVEAASGRRSPVACHGPATLAFFRGDLDGARRRAEDWVVRARLVDDPYQLANALIMSGSVLRFVSDGDADLAQAQVEEAVQISRAIGVRSTLSQGLQVLSGWLSPNEAERALALLDEAIEVGTEVGNHIAVATSAGTKAWWLAYLRRGVEALDVARDAAARMAQTSSPSMLGPGFDAASMALADLGYPEPAVVLLSASRQFAPGAPPDWVAEIIATREAALAAQLGDARYESLCAKGAAFTQAEANTYLIDAARNTRSTDD
jgi:predicted ATPase/class 3 adenylate cyclase